MQKLFKYTFFKKSLRNTVSKRIFKTKPHLFNVLTNCTQFQIVLIYFELSKSVQQWVNDSEFWIWLYLHKCSVLLTIFEFVWYVYKWNKIWKKSLFKSMFFQNGWLNLISFRLSPDSPLEKIKLPISLLHVTAEYLLLN